MSAALNEQSSFIKMYSNSLKRNLTQSEVKIQRDKGFKPHLKKLAAINVCRTNEEGMNLRISLPTIYVLKK